MGRPETIQEKKCVICGFDRIVDRAHIIPKRILKGIKGYEKYVDYDGEGTVFLCRNHHALFDTNRLTEQEGKALRKHIKHMHSQIEELLNSDIKPIKGMVGAVKVKQYINTFERWKEKFHWVLGFKKD